MKPDDKDALRDELRRLYADASKHASYQNVPDFVADTLGYRERIDEGWRGDRVRLDYLRRALAAERPQRWADFGANTGFFSLSLAHEDTHREVVAIEANPVHAAFISRIAAAFGLANLHVDCRPVGIAELGELAPVDVMLHLNVLHHAGADFDREHVRGTDDFPRYAVDYLDRLRPACRTLVFQVGTNLWGDKGRPLCDYRDDPGKLALLSGWLSEAGWRIRQIALAARTPAGVVYRDVPLAVQSMPRNEVLAHLEPFQLEQHPGEFYRRPLFVCDRTG